MGRKNRKGSRGQEELEEEFGDSAISKKDAESAENKNFVDMTFAEKRGLQRQKAADKRKSKQRCHVCGMTGHVRRDCPGISDDGRGMSRFKRKSNLKREKAIYQARKNGEPTGSATSRVEYPAEFTDHEENPLPYFDTSCDINATLEYMRFGRGKTKISRNEAVQEYLELMELVETNTGLAGMICRSSLAPNQTWEPPIDFSSLITVPLYFAVSLREDFTEEHDPLASLVQAVKSEPTIVGLFCSIDFQPETLSRKKYDEESQKKRLQYTLLASGEAGVPIQIRVAPGGATLDPAVSSVSGTDYAKALLSLQKALVEATNQFPDLKIHLTGWTGRSDHTLSLLQAFPNNIFLGLDGSVSFQKASYLHESTFDIPIDRLLLDSDAVIPSTVGKAYGRDASFHTAWWPFVAEAVATSKKTTTLIDTVNTVTSNAVKMYPKLALQAAQGEEVVDDDDKPIDST